MTAPDVELRRAWRAVAGRAHESIVDEVIARHSEPHRHYHTTTHVMWVLRHTAELLAIEADTTVDGDAVTAAALFHDVIYDPRASDNEACSAALADRAMTEVGWPPSRASAVSRLILATAAPDVTEGAEPGTAVLLDADLAVLGGEPQAYAAYVSAVRQEYGHVDEASWRVGRAAVLRGLLDHRPLFATATMRAARERRARGNLSAELASLGGRAQ
jgi:predicted metal-dependent HD superfamily phosphohydrolase